MLRIKNIKLEIDHHENSLKDKIIKILNIKSSDIKSWKISKKGLDSRRGAKLIYNYTVDVLVDYEYLYLENKNVNIIEEYKYDVPKINNDGPRPIIVGSGPGGLFSGIILAEAGLNPIIIEMGKDVDSRKKDIDLFWKTGKLDVTSNVQFGAGGAGTFSDGKLTTSVNDKRRVKLMEELINAGAPSEIEYLSKAHVGTDILINVVRNICNKIEKLGGTIMYETTFVDLTNNDNKLESIDIKDKSGNITNILCNHLILAIGHSSRKTFYKLFEKGVDMKAKHFSVGVRIEHKQSDVNICQYGKAIDKIKTAADYKLSTHANEDRGVYTFCMCPGGVVVGATSEENQVVTNGMSYYARAEENANSALLVSIKPEDYNGLENPLNGIVFQRELEKKAFELGGKNYNAPIQTVGDFLDNKKSIKLGSINPSYLPGTTLSNLHDCFPDFISDALVVALNDLGEKMPVFANHDAVMTAVESRSSSPVTIMRDKDKYMCNIFGIYPCGEGAGFAGGIVSAAIDGIKCGEKVLENI
ncbi:MAG: NAD(P)/FAD-dependent oxidoreductase [Mycoplasmatales bacterium]